MNNYDTVTEALTGLKARGFTHDFNLKEERFHCPALNKIYHPTQLRVKETYRFEGPSDPADEVVVYGITAHDGVQGTFVDGYGTYADTEAEAMLQLLKNQEPT